MKILWGMKRISINHLIVILACIMYTLRILLEILSRLLFSLVINLNWHIIQNLFRCFRFLL